MRTLIYNKSTKSFGEKSDHQDAHDGYSSRGGNKVFSTKRRPGMSRRNSYVVIGRNSGRSARKVVEERVYARDKQEAIEMVREDYRAKLLDLKAFEIPAEDDLIRDYKITLEKKVEATE